MDVLSQLLSTFKVQAEVFHNAQYCNNWAIDTSGTQYISFHIVSHGNCELMINPDTKQTIKLAAGDIVLFPHDDKHYLCNDINQNTATNIAQSIPFSDGLRADGTGLICGYFSHNHPQITQLTAHLPGYMVFHHDNTNDCILSSLIQMLIKASLANHNDSNYVLNKLSECILSMLFREHLDESKGLLAALTHPQISLAIEAIHQSAEKKWSVDLLSQQANMSRANFASLFKTLLGVPPMEYITQWRLSLGYRMLADEKSTVLATAIFCGYDNESSFSKAFKRVMGISPGKLRTK